MPALSTNGGQSERLIRKPVGQVFEALADSRMTTNFWFTRESGRLEAGKHVSTGGVPTTGEWRFTPQTEGTYVSVKGEEKMLGNKDAVANVAVKDLDVATDFYRNTLGLKPVHQEGKELVVFQSGHSSINVYRSEYAGTNKATAVTWTVDNVEDEIKALSNKGVVFEHYDMPGLTREGDVHVGDHMRIAWFKDPDGNILNVVSR